MEQAIKKLEDLKFSFRVQEVYDPVVPEGRVVSQSVLPGEMVGKDTYITIDISKGPEPTTEPPTEPSTAPSTTETPETSSSEEPLEP